MRKYFYFSIFVLVVALLLNVLVRDSYRPVSGAPEIELQEGIENLSDVDQKTLEQFQLLLSIMEKVKANYVDDVTNEKLIRGSINGMMSVLDPYSSYLDKQELSIMLGDTGGQFGGLGIEITIRNNWLTVVTPMEDTPAAAAGIKPGDRIVKIDGKSSENIKIDEALKILRGEPGSPVTLTVVHENSTEPVDITITREIIKVQSIKGLSRLGEDGQWNYWLDDQEKIAYIRITSFQNNTPQQFNDVITTLVDEGLKGLVLDLRFNPGGTLGAAIDISDRFISRKDGNGIIVSVKGRSAAEEVKYARDDNTLPYFPLVVLINNASASASEIVAGAIQDHHRGVLLGEHSYGKGSVQWIIELSNIPNDISKGAVKLTVAHYYTPSGNSISRNADTGEGGLAPDIVVPMTMDEQVNLLKSWQQNSLNKYQRESLENGGDTSAETSEEEKPFVDMQLQRAVELIKGILVYQGLHVASSK